MTKSDKNAERPLQSQTTVSHTHAGERCNKYSTTPTDTQVSDEELERLFGAPVAVQEETATQETCPNSPGFFYCIDKNGGRAVPMPCRKYRTCPVCRRVRAQRIVQQIRIEETEVTQWGLRIETGDGDGQVFKAGERDKIAERIATLEEQRIGWSRQFIPLARERVEPYGWSLVREPEWQSFYNRLQYVRRRDDIDPKYLLFRTRSVNSVLFMPVSYLQNEHCLKSELPTDDNALLNMVTSGLAAIPQDKRLSHSHGFGGAKSGYKKSAREWGCKIGVTVESLAQELASYAKNKQIDMPIRQHNDGSIDWDGPEDAFDWCATLAV